MAIFAASATLRVLAKVEDRPQLDVINRVPGVIDEELLAGLMLVAEHDVQTAAPAMVEFTEAADCNK